MGWGVIGHDTSFSSDQPRRGSNKQAPAAVLTDMQIWYVTH